jgi:hypothetical protein
MKVNVTVAERRPALGRVVNRIRDAFLSAATTERLARELEDELRAVSASQPAADASERRDALERAVRRVWGATL